MRNKNAKVTDPNSFVTCPGEKYHIIFSPRVMPDGTVDLVESGKDDIQEFIQSFKDSCDMSFILNRLEVGDVSVLAQREGMYGDFTEFPKTYAEALQKIIDAEKVFNSLPKDTRNQFDNDYMKWFATAGADDWYSKMSAVFSQEEVVSSEVISDES